MAQTLCMAWCTLLGMQWKYFIFSIYHYIIYHYIIYLKVTDVSIAVNNIYNNLDPSSLEILITEVSYVDKIFLSKLL
jgi:hypothetical protein